MFQKLTEKMKLKAICRGMQAGMSFVDLYAVNKKRVSNFSVPLLTFALLI